MERITGIYSYDSAADIIMSHTAKYYSDEEYEIMERFEKSEDEPTNYLILVDGEGLICSILHTNFNGDTISQYNSYEEFEEAVEMYIDEEN